MINASFSLRLGKEVEDIVERHLALAHYNSWRKKFPQLARCPEIRHKYKNIFKIIHLPVLPVVLMTVVLIFRCWLAEDL